jgi:5-methylcytosine-specific restriction endonuclease McrA
MSNSFGISRQDEEELRARDKTCVYCRKVMKTHSEIKATQGKRADEATIEHLNFAGPFYVRDGLRKEDLVICCRGCNSSRGERKLIDWFKLDYCVIRNINQDTVAEPVASYLRRVASL